MKFYREAVLRIRIRNEDFTYQPEIIYVNGLRVSFSIQKSLAWSINTAVIRIWNLKQQTRNRIINYGDEVALYAGYREEGGPQLLFLGDTSAVSHIYDQPEITTVLECSDGERYINTETQVTYSYAANTAARMVIEDIARQMGFVLPVRFSQTDNLIYRQGDKWTGPGRDALIKVCDKLGLQPSIQNSQLQIIPKNGTIDTTPIEINQATGMQGVPQRFTYRGIFPYRSVYEPPTGYKVNVALNPLILPGSPIILSSTHLDFKGPYFVENVRHEGDTFGFTWQSNLQVIELAGGVT